MLCYKVVCILKWVLGKNFGVPGPSSGWPVFNCVRLRIIKKREKENNKRKRKKIKKIIFYPFKN
jgi:hypothetical protein